MQRRKFVIGLGALTTGTAAAVGSGAFTSVEADRDVEVAVADDANAFLGIEPAGEGNDNYVEGDATDGTIGLNFDDPDGVDGEGINDRALTVFDNLLTITNQGTQDVLLGIDFVDEDGDPVGGPGQVGVGGAILRGEPDNLVDPGENYDYDPDEDGDTLSPGDSVNTGVFFNLDKEDDFEDVVDDLETMIIQAEAADD